jgi:hypothetical protein
MLPPFIIEQIRKREEERRQHDGPRIELPIPVPQAPRRQSVPDDEQDRGVIIVDLG